MLATLTAMSETIVKLFVNAVSSGGFRSSPIVKFALPVLPRTEFSKFSHVHVELVAILVVDFASARQLGRKSPRLPSTSSPIIVVSVRNHHHELGIISASYPRSPWFLEGAQAHLHIAQWRQFVAHVLSAPRRGATEGRQSILSRRF